MTLPTYEDLRTLYDIDHYKRLALRAKLRQGNLLWHSYFDGIAGVGIQTWMRTSGTWRSSADLLEIQRRHHQRNARVFARYEQRVLPAPLVVGLREELRAALVDMPQFCARYSAEFDRPWWRRPMFWKWFAVGVALGAALMSLIARTLS